MCQNTFVVLNAIIHVAITVIPVANWQLVATLKHGNGLSVGKHNVVCLLELPQPIILLGASYGH